MCYFSHNKGDEVLLDSDIISSKRYTGSLMIVSSKEYSFINALTHIVTEKCDSRKDKFFSFASFEKKLKKVEEY